MLRWNPGKSNKDMLPVLIIPGFMSSGLQVEDSKIKPSWKEKRIWINLASLGLQSLPVGRALAARIDSIDEESVGEEIAEDDKAGGEEEEEKEKEKEDPLLHEERVKYRIFANMWLQHMVLSHEDLTTEHPDVKIRPLSGLPGVDYLSPGALTNHLSYVFGPVINVLKRAGYKENINLQAAPYDWRIPYQALETRDGYYSFVKQTIEDMYQKNDNSPVVLLCHSMGAKVAEYFLQWIYQQNCGPSWTEKHIHTYMPLGGAHLGAPKALRGIITGDRMGLETFMSLSDALHFGRSLGSSVGLIPRELPPNASTTCAYLHKEGSLKIRVLEPIKVEGFLERRKESDRPKNLKLQFQLGNYRAQSSLAPLLDSKNARGGYELDRIESQEDQCELSTNAVSLLDEFFITSSSEPPRQRDDKLWISLMEPGLTLAKSNKGKKRKFPNPRRCVYADPIPPCLKYFILWLLFMWSLWLGVWLIFLVVVFVFCFLYYILYGLWIMLANYYMLYKSLASTLAFATVISVRDVLGTPGKPTRVQIELLSKETTGFWIFGERKKTSLVIELTWIPSTLREYPGPPIARHSSVAHGGVDPLQRGMKISQGTAYEIPAVSGYQVMAQEGQLSGVLKTFSDVYDPDPCVQKQSSPPPPPGIRCVKAIYGVNLPTEVAAVYRRRPVFVKHPHNTKMHSRLVLDSKATLPLNRKESNGHIISEGIVKETKNTLQTTSLRTKNKQQNEKPGTRRVMRSGDGTVPYWSLNCVESWESEKVQVSVTELEGAEHREILADPRFHKVLLDYVITEP